MFESMEGGSAGGRRSGRTPALPGVIYRQMTRSPIKTTSRMSPTRGVSHTFWSWDSVSLLFSRLVLIFAATAFPLEEQLGVDVPARQNVRRESRHPMKLGETPLWHLCVSDVLVSISTLKALHERLRIILMNATSLYKRDGRQVPDLSGQEQSGVRYV